MSSRTASQGRGTFSAKPLPPATANLLLPDDPTGASLLPHTVADYFKDSIEVPVVRLDSLTTSANLLKLDVQGFELEVLEGAKGILDTTEVIPTELSLYNFQQNPLIHEVVAYLVEHGFRIFDYDGEVRLDDGVLAQIDFVFVSETSPLSEISGAK